jgi:Spermine/spermidine synthase domain
MARPSQWADLFLISAFGLFFEIMLIRWEGVELRQFAYFKNFAFISIFVGMGIGFALKERRDLSGWAAPLLGGLLMAIAFGGPLARQVHGASHFIKALGANRFDNTVFAVVLGVGFLWNLCAFIPVGQWTGRAMQGLPVMAAYSVNVAGGLAGIGAFVALAAGHTPPTVWFATGAALVFLLLRARPRALLIAILSMGIAVFVVHRRRDPGVEVVWSPYQKLVLTPGGQGPGSWNLQVSADWYQYAADFSPPAVARSPQVAEVAAHYSHPFMQRPSAERVLILGAGMGNDVAAALRAGAKHVDAVEIDPGIIDLGRRYHPERPYDDPRVSIIANDARAFLERTSQRYDVIVFTLIDSQTLLESMSSVRLDNYIYTVECFRRARSLVSSGGLLSVSFNLGQPWLSRRVHDLLLAAFGHEPISLASPYHSGPVYFIEGAFRLAIASDAGLAPVVFPKPLRDVPTDDWPYLYLVSRGIPLPYLGGIALGLLVTVIAAVIGFRGSGGFDTFDGHFFLLGAGFFLIETKGLTELALLFGSTWTVNAIGFATVMVFILAANALASTRWRLRPEILYPLLLASIAIGYGATFANRSGAGLGSRFGASLLLFLPVFFAGLVFASSIERTGNLPAALASNLMGAVLGGFAEYWSMIGGTRSLYLVAAVFYLASWLRMRAQPLPSPSLAGPNGAATG